MYTFEYDYRVRYADVDQMGYVYYGNYAKFYEIVRVEAMRSMGIRYKTMEEEGIIMPVYDCYSKYLFPAKYDELITIRLFIKSPPSARMVFSYEIFNEEKLLIHTGETTLVFIKQENNKITTCPDNIRKILAPFFK